MKGFIEIQSLSDGSKMLMAVNKITAIVECDYGVFIETDVDGKGRPVGVPVAESYDDIKTKILNAG